METMDRPQLLTKYQTRCLTGGHSALRSVGGLLAKTGEADRAHDHDGSSTLAIVGTSVIFGHGQLELPTHGLMLRLFRLFAVARDGRCGLREILAIVYQIRPVEASTRRFRRSARIRAVKLLSRARCLAKTHLCPERDWFSYEPETRTWRLCTSGDEKHILH